MRKEGRDGALTIREMSREEFVGEQKSFQASPTNQRTVYRFPGKRAANGWLAKSTNDGKATKGSGAKRATNTSSPMSV
jgi:hypothetical protein